MITLFKKPATVEEIHQEFDSSEQKIIDECNKLLSECNIVTQTQVERKSEMLKSLGFVNSETVKISEELKNKYGRSKKQLNQIMDYKRKYPRDKFITVDELDRICKKYKLIHAPVNNYIKDVPEKNLLEIKNSTPLSNGDRMERYQIITSITFMSGTPSSYKKFVRENMVNNSSIDISRFSDTNFKTIVKGLGYEGSFGAWGYDRIKLQTVDMSGYHIAAPKSHFNLDNLMNKTKFGFFNVTTTEVKDPVVFEYCKGNICRIITKWGTDDDQSYLEPSLFNENNN